VSPHESATVEPTSTPFYVYIVRCADGSLYVGHTEALEERVMRHNEGRGATWTAARLPVMLVYSEACAGKQQAVRRERQLKGWSRAKKEALIAGDKQRLKKLAASRSSAQKSAAAIDHRERLA